MFLDMLNMLKFIVKREKNTSRRNKPSFCLKSGVTAQPHTERKWKVYSQTGILEFSVTVPYLCIRLNIFIMMLLFQSFAMRKDYFNNPETGFFKKVKRKVIPKNPMTGTSYYNIQEIYQFRDL